MLEYLFTFDRNLHNTRHYNIELITFVSYTEERMVDIILLHGAAVIDLPKNLATTILKIVDVSYDIFDEIFSFIIVWVF